MENLPQDIVDIILDYKYGLEHFLKFQDCLVEMFLWGVVTRPYWSVLSLSYWLPF